MGHDADHTTRGIYATWPHKRYFPVMYLIDNISLDGSSDLLLMEIIVQLITCVGNLSTYLNTRYMKTKTTTQTIKDKASKNRL